MSFLKAEWRKLAILNYQIDPQILEKHLPFGTELDLWEGKCIVSIVGFMFINTKVLGMKIPGHINFEEVNLRFYVKRFENGELKRGVVFIKEIVPKRAITFVANTLYQENYETLKMDHSWLETETERTVEYKWFKNNQWNSFKLQAQKEAKALIPGSETEFITEHYWGYAQVHSKKSTEYEVTHPTWDVYPVKDYEININFTKTYGQEFAILDKKEPISVMLAEGSEITVESKRNLIP
jgi:uncharacterized protein YqjF (DUF2071 family)